MYVCVLGTTLTSCKKQEHNDSMEAKSLTVAMQIFEQSRTKSSAANFVKPLPGTFTPTWEQAAQRRVGDNLITTVPIDAQVNYTATYPCSGHHAGESHSHDQIPIIQKLVVSQMPDSSACYIVNITPYEDCSLNADALKDFIVGDDLVGFSGFVAYHNLNAAYAVL